MFRHNTATTNDYQLTTVQTIYLENGSIIFRAESQEDRDHQEQEEQDYLDRITALSDYYDSAWY